MFNYLTKIDLSKLWVVHELFRHFHFWYYHPFFCIFCYDLLNYCKDLEIYIINVLHHFLSLKSLSQMNLRMFQWFLIFFLRFMKLNCLRHLYKNNRNLIVELINLDNLYYYNLLNLNMKLTLLFFFGIQVKTMIILANFNWQPHSSLF